MYDQLKNKSIAEQAEFLTRSLVAIKSYNSSQGETEKARFIKKIILSFPYFQQHASEVWEQEIPHDPYGRVNIFARIKGKTRKTILFHAHLDTVGTEDYGSLQEGAHDPDLLEKFFVNFNGDDFIRNEAKSGNWLFGRGALDMQSGIAVNLVNLLYFSQQPEPLDGDLLYLFNVDEENQHRGILNAVEELYKMRKSGSHFIAGINNDFISPMFPEDKNKYIYTGAAGKILPCFYIYGRESHVGDVFHSIDPTHLAADIIHEINHNLQLTERIKGEYTLPPTCLYLKETKKQYNVQTPVSVKLYFNYFIYERSPSEVLEDFFLKTINISNRYKNRAKKQFEVFRKQQGFPEIDLNWSIDVTTLSDYIDKLEAQGINAYDVMKKVYRNQSQGKDEREVAFEIIEVLQQYDSDKSPRIILFFAPPYLPNNDLDQNDELACKVKSVVESTLKELSQQVQENFVLRRFFPYLADGSFLSISTDDKDIQTFKKNMPLMDELYSLPIKKIKELNIPSLNLGVYGKDGHKWTERVYKPYSFGILPKVIQTVTVELLKI
ncbi:M20/M25/M40 family metallo-hydrolase [Bacillus spongiae]|uniref:M20/M25/M40 family metallo-hydrolase n=1 Tax=Bacillus spongiae TaxID=2683610 RepID=A0ABU8HAV9_9BACI